MFFLFFLLLILCKCKQAAAAWDPRHPPLYLLVEGISYFPTITLSGTKSVCLSECESTAASHRVNKHWAWSHKEQKQNGCVGVLRSRRTKCRERKPASHSNNSVPLTPSHHHAMTTEIWQLSGDAKTPRYQLERLERSQDKSRGVFRRQTTPNTPNTPSFHLFQLAYQSNRMTADSILKQHQSGAQMANGSRVAIKQHKEPDVSQDRYGQSWHLTEMDLGHFLKSSQHFLFFFYSLMCKVWVPLTFSRGLCEAFLSTTGNKSRTQPRSQNETWAYIPYSISLHVWADSHVLRQRGWHWSLQASDPCSWLCLNICKCETSGCF